MANSLLGPVGRLIDRWKTRRALAQLSPRLLRDAGIETASEPWDNISIAKRGYWIGRQEK